MRLDRSGGLLGISVGLVLGLLVAAGLASAARAQETHKTDGELVAFDASAQAVVIRIVKAGADSALERGAVASFAVKPKGSVLDKTAVTRQGARVDLASLAAGETLAIYWQWRPGEAGEDIRFARRIDVAVGME